MTYQLKIDITHTIRAIDRVQAIKEEKKYFEENDLVDFNEFFDDVFGVLITVGRTVHKI